MYNTRVKWTYQIEKGGSCMPIIYKNKKYLLVDVIYDDEYIYDILEDENGNRIKVISGYLNY